MSEPLLSIVIANYNKPNLIAKCMETIDVHMRGIVMEVIIVDNNSKTQDLEKISQSYEYVRVVYLYENMGFGYANNVGVSKSRGKVLLFLNSDTEIVDSSLSDVIRDFVSVDAKVIWGTKLIWPDGRFQKSYSKEIKFLDYLIDYTPLSFARRYFSFMSGHKYHDVEFDDVTEVGVIWATALIIRKIDFEMLRGFSRKYYMYFEDVDLCDRFRHEHSGKVFFNPKATIIHNVMGSSKKNPDLNWEYLKSKYKYGFEKFGPLRAMLFIGLDFLLLIAIPIRIYIRTRCGVVR